MLLTAPRTEILLPAGFGPLKANHEDIGVYRVNYDAELRAALIAGLTALPVADQLNLLADTWALSRAGRLPATQSLELVSVLRESTDPTVLSQVVDTINTIDSYQTGRPGRAAWCAWAIATLSPILDRVGWSPAPGEREIVATLRGHLVGTLGQLGDPTVIAEAYARFPLYLADPTSLPPDLIRPVLNTVGRQAEPATYDQLLALARGALATELKTDAYNAAARAIDPALARRTLALALDPATPTSVANYLPITVARHGEHPDLVWSFVVDRLDELLARVTPMERYDYAANIAGTALDAARARELLALYAEKFPPDAAPMAARAAEGIRTRVEFRHRELDGLDAWIAARPVARPE